MCIDSLKKGRSIDSLNKEGQSFLAVVCLIKISPLKTDLVDGSKMGVSRHTVQRVFLTFLLTCSLPGFIMTTRFPSHINPDVNPMFGRYDSTFCQPSPHIWYGCQAGFDISCNTSIAGPWKITTKSTQSFDIFRTLSSKLTWFLAAPVRVESTFSG